MVTMHGRLPEWLPSGECDRRAETWEPILRVQDTPPRTQSFDAIVHEPDPMHQ